MADVFKKNWGKSRVRFCPTNKIVWSQKRDGTVVTHRDMPTYGMEREEMPNLNKGDNNGQSNRYAERY